MILSFGDIDTLIKVVAWSNPSQGSNFAGQTIALSYNVSNYTSYELIWKYEPNAIQYVSSGKLQIGSGHLMIGMASNCFITLRGLNIMSNKQATFGDGVYVQSYGNSYTPVSNNYCIPMYIYLYK